MNRNHDFQVGYFSLNSLRRTGMEGQIVDTKNVRARHENLTS